MTLKSTTTLVAAVTYTVLFTSGPAYAEEKGLAFRFNWPVGTKATVVTTGEKQKEFTGKQTEKVTATSRFTVVVEKAENDRLAIVSDMQGVPQIAKNGVPMTEQNLLLASLGSMLPTTIVNRNGEFAGIKDVDRMLGAFKKLISAAFKEEPIPPNFQELFDGLLSEQTLTVAAANHWNTEIGMWIGQELEPGEEYEAKGMAPLPLPGAPAVEIVTRIEVEGPLACDGGKGKKLCARIKTSGKPDLVQAKKVLDTFMKNMAKPDGKTDQPFYKDIDISSSMTLLTEMDTLKPHDIKTEKIVRITFLAPDSKEHKAVQTDRGHSTYTYEK